MKCDSGKLSSVSPGNKYSRPMENAGTIKYRCPKMKINLEVPFPHRKITVLYRKPQNWISYCYVETEKADSKHASRQ